ncbi:hypothetical protein AB205_0145170, partial [Aquarana catesbeiana]
MIIHPNLRFLHKCSAPTRHKSLLPFPPFSPVSLQYNSLLELTDLRHSTAECWGMSFLPGPLPLVSYVDMTLSPTGLLSERSVVTYIGGDPAPLCCHSPWACWDCDVLGGMVNITRHTRGPLDGSLYARVKKKTTPLTSTNGSPEQHGRLLSVSSDSGHSSAATERFEETPQKILPTAAERQDLEKLLGGFGVSVKQEAEPQYSQVLRREEVVTTNAHQKQNLEGRIQDVQYQVNHGVPSQNIQPKMNGESKLQYSPPWSAMSDEGASQSLPLTPPSWDEQRESPCENPWEGQADRETAILEEQMGQIGGLAMYPGRRSLLSRHCSCRSGYAGPSIEGLPNRSYFRSDGIFDSHGPPGTSAVLQ